MSSQNLQSMNKQAKVFPKLFIGSASVAFRKFIEKHNYNYKIHYISSRDDLISLIETFSQYKNYNLPVIISDISFLNKRDQSLLLKFMDDTNLNLILLASRDNILDTIISRVREFRKYYVSNINNKAGFIVPSKARAMLVNEAANECEEISYEDKLTLYSKYNPILSYDELLVKSFRNNDKKKLLNLLEY